MISPPPAPLLCFRPPQVVPGVGKFSVRYFEAKAAVEAEALERAKERSRELAASKRRRWWPWGGN